MNQMQKMFSLEGKTAVVTGGSGLYGRQITLGLCQMGAKVIIASRNIEKNEEYAKELRAQLDRRIERLNKKRGAVDATSYEEDFDKWVF